MSYNSRNKGRGRLNSHNTSHFSEHDERLESTRSNYQRKYVSRRGNFSRGHFQGSRGRSNNYRGNYRSNRVRRPYGNRGGSYRYHKDDRNDSSPFHTDRDGDVSMDGDEESSNLRFTPYGRTRRNRNTVHSNSSQSENFDAKKWHRILIPNGSKLDEDWLIEEIRSMGKVHVIPHEYHADGSNGVFFTQDQSVADAIRSCSKRISSPDGGKIPLIVQRSNPPPLDSFQLDKIKEVLGDRFSEQDQHMNLSSFYHEEKLRDFRVKLGTFYHSFVVGKLIADHIPSLTSVDLSNNSLRSCDSFKYLVSRTPSVKKLNLKKNQLKSFKDLSCLELWDLTELTLDQNPLCASFKSQIEYISDAREHFPNLLVLDGHTLAPPVKFDVDSGTLPKASRDFLSPSGQTLINQFIQQFFVCYDQSRSNLSEAYSDVALLSVTIPSSPRGPTLSPYFEFNRNLKRAKKGAGVGSSRIYSSRTEIISKLTRFPPTHHLLPSFAIDVPLVTSSIVNFIVRGYFNETADHNRLRAFSRSFFCQVHESSLLIINEQYFIRNPTAVEMKEAKTLDAASSSLPAQTTSQRPQMVASFAKESGMNEKYSEQCLQENDWNYEKAASVFMELKAQGKIPPEAYAK